MSKFAIVDLSNLFQRARHGAVSDPETKVALAVLIVFRSLRKLHRDFQFDHIVFAVDQGSWRYHCYPAYKSRRKLAQLATKPSEQAENAAFFTALDALVEFLACRTRCTVLQAADTEGDDFVAHWIAHHPHSQHVIISGDSDFVQLIGANVRIYDAINQRLIAHDQITDERGRLLAFSISPKDGKIKVGSPAPQFQPEPDWWEKALFIKLLRGDAGDSVFPAYPGVRYESKRCSIRAAWDDRHEQGYDWNNLMFQSWQKLVGVDASGTPVTETVRVIDEYKINQTLIDLHQQPVEVRERLAVTIQESLVAAPIGNVGVNFLRFCAAHDQPMLAKEATDHVAYLNASYPKGQTP